MWRCYNRECSCKIYRCFLCHLLTLSESVSRGSDCELGVYYRAVLVAWLARSRAFAELCSARPECVSIQLFVARGLVSIGRCHLKTEAILWPSLPYYPGNQTSRTSPTTIPDAKIIAQHFHHFRTMHDSLYHTFT